MTDRRHPGSRRCIPYRQLLSQGTDLLSLINPNAHPADANCPETADAVNDFLNSGRIRSVRTASGSAIFQFPPNIQWSAVTLHALAVGLRNCSHAVVRGTRDAPGPDVTREHYFVVFKVDNVVWVADAYSIELTRGIENYVNSEPLPQRMRTFAVPTGGAYDVVIDDPLSGL